MRVNVIEFKKQVDRAKTALSTGAVDGGEGHLMLQLQNGVLRVGGRGVSLSYTGIVQPIDCEGFPTSKKIYIPLSSLQTLLDLQGTEIDLTLDAQDLHIGDIGLITVSSGFQYWTPETKVQGDPYLLLQSGSTLAKAIEFVEGVKVGWSVKTRPYAAGFVRLQLADESNFREEADQEVDVCRILLDVITSDQDMGVGYESAMALSVFASDESRYFQAFEPAFIRPGGEKVEEVPVSTILDPRGIGMPIHLLLDDATSLRKVLPDETLRVHLLLDEKSRIKALIFFNASTFIWVQAALHVYPDDDFNHQLAYFNGQEIARFTATPGFKKTVSAAEKLKATREHGLTFMTKEDSIYISSPEGESVVRYGDNPAEVDFPGYLCVINSAAFKTALTKMKGEVTVVAGVEFLALYNPTTKTRIVFRTYKR